MLRICMICKRVLEQGPPPASHGICKSCYDKQEKEVAKATLLRSQPHRPFVSPRSNTQFSVANHHKNGFRREETTSC